MDRARNVFLILSLSMSLSISLSPASALASDSHSLGPGRGIVEPGARENPCPGSELLQNADGSYEWGYAWQYGGVQPPYFGAFAEGYSARGTVCGISYKFTTVGWIYNRRMDCYIWAGDGEGNPQEVLAIVERVDPGNPANWPHVSTHDVAMPETVVDGEFFVGYWGDWPGGLVQWWVAVDLDGPGGLPRTHIAPGIGYPSGWQDPEVVWGPTRALGLDAYVLLTPPTSVVQTTWGCLKALHR